MQNNEIYLGYSRLSKCEMSPLLRSTQILCLFITRWEWHFRGIWHTGYVAPLFRNLPLSSQCQKFAYLRDFWLELWRASCLLKIGFRFPYFFSPRQLFFPVKRILLQPCFQAFIRNCQQVKRFLFTGKKIIVWKKET